MTIVARFAALLMMGALVGCQSDPVQTVDGTKIVMDTSSDGQVKVHGLAGAIPIQGATSVTLTVLSASPVGRKVMHLGKEEVVIDSRSVDVKADGGFDVTVLGKAEAPVLPEDELSVTPYRGLEQAGFTLYLFVPL